MALARAPVFRVFSIRYSGGEVVKGGGEKGSGYTPELSPLKNLIRLAKMRPHRERVP